MTKSNPLGGVECLKERLEQFSEEKREVLFVTHQGMWDRSTFWLNFRHTQTLSSCQGDTYYYVWNKLTVKSVVAQFKQWFVL